MLQINTGKFFTRGVGRTNQLCGVLYSNALIIKDEIRTEAGTLRPTDLSRKVQTIVYELEELIEKSERKSGILVSHTVKPYLEDFAVVASFGLKLIFSTNMSVVERLTANAGDFASYRPPNEFVKRFFDDQRVITACEKSKFIDLIHELLSLERKYFLAAMHAIRTYVAGLHRIYDDLGLAYTLLVSSVETLAQKFDNFEGSWDDLSEQKRKPIDIALSDIDSNNAKAIREAILKNEHTSMARRFREFILDKVGADFYRKTNLECDQSINAELLPYALKYAYRIRSEYIHLAKELPDELKIPFKHWEIRESERRPLLTLQGLSRIARHTIREFIRKSPKADKESYNYKHELAGVIHVTLAPQYWVGSPLKKPKHATRRLEGLLIQIKTNLNSEDESTITDLSGVLKKVELYLSGSLERYKPSLYALYILYNSIVAEEDRSSSLEKIRTAYGYLLDIASPEILIVRTILGDHTWPINTHQDAYDQYWKERWMRDSFHAPRLFEVAATLDLAERYRKEDKTKKVVKLICKAVENYAGNESLIQLEKEFNPTKTIIWNEILIQRD